MFVLGLLLALMLASCSGVSAPITSNSSRARTCEDSAEPTSTCLFATLGAGELLRTLSAAEPPGSSGSMGPVDTEPPARPIELGRRDPDAADEAAAEAPSTTAGSTITASDPEPEPTDSAAGDRVVGVAPVAMRQRGQQVGEGWA